MKKIFTTLFFWSFALVLLAQEPQLILPIGHTDIVNTVHFSPDSKRVLTASDDHTVKIWDAQSGFLLANLTGHHGAVLCAFFTRSGDRIVTVSTDYTVKFWDSQTGKMVLNLTIDVLPKRSEQIDDEQAILSPDEKKIITFSSYSNHLSTGYDSSSLKVWDTRTGALLKKVICGNRQKLNNNVLFGADSKKIIAVGDRDSVKVWDVLKGAMIDDPLGDKSSIFSAIYTVGGKKILRAAIDGTLQVLNAETKSTIATIKIPDSFPVFASFSPDGKKIVVVAANGGVSTCDSKTGAITGTYNGHNTLTIHASLSSDGKMIARADLYGNIKIVNRENEAAATMISDLSAKFKTTDRLSFEIGAGDANMVNHIKDVHLAEISPDGKLVATTFSGNSVSVWDAGSGSLLTNLTGHSSKINTAFFSPDGGNILIALEDNLAQVWDNTTGSVKFNLQGHSKTVLSATYSKDGSRILTGSPDHTAKIWDAASGKLIRNFNQDNGEIYSAIFNPDGTKILTASRQNNIKVWDIASGRKSVGWHDRTVPPSLDWGFNSAVFNPDGSMVLAASGDGTVSVFTNGGASFAGKLHEQLSGYTSAVFSPSGTKMLATNDPGSPIRLFTAPETFYDRTDLLDVRTGSLWSNLKGHIAGIHSLIFSKDGARVVTSSDTAAYIYDLVSGRLVWAITGHKDKVISSVFSPDGKMIVTTSADHTAKIWKIDVNMVADWEQLYHLSDDDLKKYPGYHYKAMQDYKKLLADTTEADTTGYQRMITQNNGNRNFISRDYAHCVLMADLKGHSGSVVSAAFSADSKKIITVSEDNTAKIWNAATGKLVYTFFTVDSADYFAQIDGGYYKCTQNAAKDLHYVTGNLDVITFDQLDIRYNRPDKVLEAIGCPDTALIHAYRRAYEKRIEKLGIDTTSFKSGYSLPKADFKNRDNIAYVQKQDQLTLHINGSDSTYALDRFNVWVNQVPVYGIKGVSLRGKKRNTLDTVVTITLSSGYNRVETSVTDVNGTESYHTPLNVKYTPAKPVDTLLHFIGIGIDKFADKTRDLQWSTRDIMNLALKLKEKYGSKCLIDTLFNENVTTANVVALKKGLAKSGVNDKVIVAYSGHGLFSKSYDYFLSTYSTNFNDPAKNGLPYDALENLLDSIPARKKLMLIDACNSGEIDKDELNKLNAAKKTLDSNKVTPIGSRGGTVTVTSTGLSSAGSFELMQHLFVNVRKSNGATIISAAGGFQYALEKNDLKDGVFTYSILECMKQNPHVNLSALRQYVNKRVFELTAGLQVPTTRNETNVVDWQVW